MRSYWRELVGYLAFGLLLFGAGAVGLMLSACAPISITDGATGDWRVPWWMVGVLFAGAVLYGAWKSRR